MHFTLCDLITDITQNGAESGADLLELEIAETDRGVNGNPELRFIVRDNGKGMSPEGLKRAMDPFVTDGIKHPNRKVGLGIPFLIQTAEQSGGGWDIKSQKAGLEGFLGEGGHGTTVTAFFDTSNVDTPPIGDIPGMFRTIILFEGPDEVHISRTRSSGDRTGGTGGESAGSLAYEVRKSELIEALGNLEDTQSLILLDQYLRSLETEN
ncbi:ATPase [Spirochaetia bacterium]|nr:ATPase [Spirochaetia bacterium]